MIESASKQQEFKQLEKLQDAFHAIEWPSTGSSEDDTLTQAHPTPQTEWKTIGHTENHRELCARRTFVDLVEE